MNPIVRPFTLFSLTLLAVTARADDPGDFQKIAPDELPKMQATALQLLKEVKLPFEKNGWGKKEEKPAEGFIEIVQAFDALKIKTKAKLLREIPAKK